MSSSIANEILPCALIGSGVLLVGFAAVAIMHLAKRFKFKIWD